MVAGQYPASLSHTYFTSSLRPPPKGVSRCWKWRNIFCPISLLPALIRGATGSESPHCPPVLLSPLRDSWLKVQAFALLAGAGPHNWGGGREGKEGEERKGLELLG